HIHEYEILHNPLVTIFEDTGVQALRKESWNELDYGFVKESADNVVTGRTLGYIESPKKKSSEGLFSVS
ncbi:hypothetical protein, partial [Peribacillus frigoritolerans]|uniref:hypothetical protein n=1 Tax=Peribacillus frigoritolerans TaxID=450367 RepID=UPI00202545A2